VPKSKVRKKPEAPTRSASLSSSPSGKALAPSPSWYPIVMAVVLVLGLAYLVVYYLTSSGTQPHVPLMADLGAWNFAVGFGVMLLGLIMAVRWR
jgi:hydrogenase-4 membrane subunit HyfE